MDVRLELEPEIEAALNQQANAKGISLDEYLREVIEERARISTAPEINLDEFRKALDQLAEMGKGLPHLPSSAFSREAIYQDHD